MCSAAVPGGESWGRLAPTCRMAPRCEGKLPLRQPASRRRYLIQLSLPRRSATNMGVFGRRGAGVESPHTATTRLPALSMLNFFPGGITVVALYSVTMAGPWKGFSTPSSSRT